MIFGNRDAFVLGRHLLDLLLPVVTTIGTVKECGVSVCPACITTMVSCGSCSGAGGPRGSCHFIVPISIFVVLLQRPVNLMALQYGFHLPENLPLCNLSVLVQLLCLLHDRLDDSDWGQDCPFRVCALTLARLHGGNGHASLSKAVALLLCTFDGIKSVSILAERIHVHLPIWFSVYIFRIEFALGLKSEVSVRTNTATLLVPVSLRTITLRLCPGKRILKPILGIRNAFLVYHQFAIPVLCHLRASNIAAILVCCHAFQSLLKDTLRAAICNHDPAPVLEADFSLDKRHLVGGLFLCKHLLLSEVVPQLVPIACGAFLPQTLAALGFSAVRLGLKLGSWVKCTLFIPYIAN